MHSVSATIILALFGASVAYAAPAPQGPVRVSPASGGEFAPGPPPPASVVHSVVASATASANGAQFTAFAGNDCQNQPLGIASTQNQGNNEICFTLDSTAHSFEASTDGFQFRSFSQANCKGTELGLNQGSCDENLTFKAVLQINDQ